MAKKRNLAPESSQLVEPPLKQRQSEALQENLPVQEDDQDFEEAASLLQSILATPAYKYASSSIRKHLVESFWRKQRMEASRKRELEALGATATSPLAIAFEQSSTSPFSAAQAASLLESILATNEYKYASYDVRRRLVEAFWKNPAAIAQEPAFRGIRPFGRATPTSVWKQLAEAGGFGSTVQTMTWEQLGSTGAPAFGARRIYGGTPSNPISVISRPTITEEHGGTSGQTAYNYERFESCVAIAGEDYCVIAVDFTRDHTKILQLSGKSVMAACYGFQADMKALQILSAENLEYEGQHKKPMSCPEMHILFSHVERSHPIYDFVLLGGLDSEGKGCLFQHAGPDVFASRVGYSSQDSGSRLIVPPILNYKLPGWGVLARLSETEAVDLAKTVFASTTNTGDKLEIVVLNANGLRRNCVDLRKDCD